MLQSCLLSLLEGDDETEDSDKIIDREAATLALAETINLLRRGLRKWLAVKL